MLWKQWFYCSLYCSFSIVAVIRTRVNGSALGRWNKLLKLLIKMINTGIHYVPSIQGLTQKWRALWFQGVSLDQPNFFGVVRFWHFQISLYVACSFSILKSCFFFFFFTFSFLNCVFSKSSLLKFVKTPKTAPRRRKMAPRLSQDRSETLQDRPRWPKHTPRWPQEAPVEKLPLLAHPDVAQGSF